MRRPAGRTRRTAAFVLVGAVMLVGGLPGSGPLTSPAGADPASDGNPNLAPSCGLDVTLVLDDSGSINASEADDVRDAAELFANSLVGTPSRLKTVVFSTRATGAASNGAQTSNLNNVVFRDPADYVAPTSGEGDGGTNWDDGLEVARRSSEGPGDLVVFITDGDPTYGNNVTPDGHLNDNSQALTGNGSDPDNAGVLSRAVTEGDLLKSSGTHVFGIGVGLTGAAQEQRLSDVTGDDEMTISGGVPTPPFESADYIIAPNFSDLESIVFSFVRELCGDTLSVSKVLQKADGTEVPADASTPWEFTTTLDPAPLSWENPVSAVGATASLTSDASGGVSFAWDGGQTPTSHVADLVETPQAGWVYNGALCTKNDFSGGPPITVLDTVGDNVPGAQGDVADLDDLVIEARQGVSCTIYNRQIRSATISVAKQTVPAGLPGDFDFTLSEGGNQVGTVTGLSHGESGSFAPVAAGTYTVAEAAAPGFTTAGSCDDLATPADDQVDPSTLTVTEGQSWTCTFTNTAANGTVKVVKDAQGADGTFAFTSTVPGLGDFDLTTTNGAASTAAVSVPVGTYSVAETVGGGWTLADSSCTGGDAPASIQVGPGEDVVCTFTNTAPDPTIEVSKTATPTSVAEPGGPVSYSVTVLNTSIEALTLDTLTDSVDGGPATTLDGVGTCATGQSIAAGASYSCTFTAPVAGNAGDTVTDVVAASASDSDGNDATDSDDASVDVTDVEPSLSVTKTPDVTSISEPGGAVTYRVEVTNTGVEPLVVDSVTDSVEGGAPVDVTQVAGTVTATSCDALVGSTVSAGDSAACEFTVQITIDASDVADGTLDDTVTVTGKDDEGNTESATADAAVFVTDVLPAVTVTKTASPDSVAETGPGETRAITYTVSVTNDAAESVVIDSITDSVDGAPAVDAGGDCGSLLGTTLAPAQTKSCTFVLNQSGNAGSSIGDLATAIVSDDDGNDASDSDDASVTFTDVDSSIQVTKTASTDTVTEPGGDVTYTVNVTNTSTTDSVTINAVTDSIDGGPASAAGGDCPDLVGDVLAPGQTTGCSFTMAVSGNAGTSVTDVVTVSGTDDDANPVSDSDDATVRVTDVASSIQVVKTADVDAVTEPGGPVSFTVDITNTSDSDTVTIDSIVDSVDGGAAFPAEGTCDDLVGTTLIAGASTSCSFTVPVLGGPGDTVADTVTVSGTDDDGAAVSDSAGESVAVNGLPSSLAVTKTADVPSVAEPGGPVTYTVSVTNTSAADAVTLDAIVDSVDGGAASAAGGDCPDLIGDVLGVGASASCSFTLSVTGNDGDTVSDTVTVDGTDDDGEGVTASADETVAITGVSSSIEVSKSADVASVPEPGGNVTYTVTVQNTSATDSVTIDSVRDSVDGGAPFDAQGDCPDLIGDVLPPGGSTSCSFTLAVSGNAGDSVSDTVTVAGTDDDGDPVSDDGSAIVGISDVGASLTVAKVADPTSVPEPGGDVAYTVTIKNVSPTDPITIDSIVDSVDGGPDLAAGGTCISLHGTTLDPGATAQCSFSLPVVGQPGDSLSDTVTVSGSDDDGNTLQESSSATVEITNVPSSISITKVANVDSVAEPGGPVTYTVTVQNTSAVDSVTIDSIVDSVDGGAPAAAQGDCPALVGDSLAPGETTSCSFTLPVTGDAGDTVADVVTVSGTDDDGAAVADEASESVAITDVTSSLSVTKVANVDSVPEPGGPVTYTVTIQNTSAADVIVLESIVDSVDGGAASAVDGTCSDLIGDALNPGASTSCEFTMSVTGDGGDVVADVVTVSGSDDDGASVSAQGEESVAITDVGSSIQVTKTANVDSVPEPGGPVVFTVTIQNTSEADAVTIGSIVDSVSGGAPEAAGGTCPGLIGDSIDPGGQTSCAFTLDVTGNDGDVVADTVTVSGTDADGAPVSDTGDESVAITGTPSAISVTKVANVASVLEPGGPVTYTVTVTNTSASDTVTIDSIVDSVEGGAPIAAGGNCPDRLGTVLDPGQSLDCTFTLQVSGNAGDSVGDVVTVAGTDDDGAAVSAEASEVVDVSDVASGIAVTKVANVDSVPEPGGPVTYTVQVTNTSTSDTMTIDSIVDSVDGGAAAAAGGTCPDLIGDVLDTGASASCSFTLDVAGNAGDSVSDTVTASGTDDDGNELSAQASEVVDIADVPSSIAVTKVADVDTLPEPGGPVTYTVQVTNTSAVDTVTIGSIVDSVDGAPAQAATGSCPDLVGDDLAPGQSTTCTFTLDHTGPGGSVIDDTVTVTGVDDDGAPVSAEGSESVTITDLPSGIEVTKVASVDDVLEPGADVDFTVTIKNTSVADVVTIGSVTDSVSGGTPFPVEGSCDDLIGTTLDPQGTTSCSFTLAVFGNGGEVVPDTVTVTGTDDDGNPVSDSADESVAITDVVGGIQVDKVASVGSVPEPGAPVDFRVIITNASADETVTIGSITDSVSGGTPFPVPGDCATLVGVTLDPGGATECTFGLLVSGNGGDVVPDTVTVTGTDEDGVPVSDSADESVAITESASTLAVTKVADVDSVPEPGGPVTYTVTVANTSELNAVTIDSITDSVSGGAPFDAQGDCPDLIGDVLAAGQSTSCSFTLPVTGDGGQSVPDTVTVSGTDDAGGPVSGEGSEVVDITDAGSSLAVTKTPSVDSVPEPGGPVTYTVTATNTSATNSITIDSITDSVDGGAPFAAGGDCPDLIGEPVAAGATVTCSFTLDVTGSGGDVVEDTVTITGTDDAAAPGAGQLIVSADAAVAIAQTPSSLTVTKVAGVDSVPEPGGPVTYTVTVANTSPVNAVTIDSITDAVDGGVPFDAPGDCPGLVGDVLAAGGSTSCSFTLDVTGDGGDVVADTVTVNATDDAGSPLSAEGSESVSITDLVSSVFVTKVANVDTVNEPGGPVTYTVTITNPSAADDITIDSVTDSVDGGAPFAAGGDCPDLVGDVLAPSGSASCSFTLPVNGAAGDTVSDTVTVGATDDRGNPLSAQASEVVGVVGVPPSATLTKTAGSSTVPETGGPVTYTVTVTNTSAVEPATITSLVDVVGGSTYNITTVGGPISVTDCAVGVVLAPGASSTCSFTFEVPGGPVGSTVSDTVTATLVDPQQNPVTASDSAIVTIVDVPPTITVTKDGTPTSLPAPGGEVRFDVSVKNTGVEPVTVLAITDSIDGGTPFSITSVAPPVLSTTCAVGASIAPGETYTCSFTLRVEGDESTVVVDNVVATVVDDDGTSATASDDAVTTITASADVSIDKQLLGDDLEVDSQGTYQLVVTNHGPSVALAVEVVDQLPDGVTAISAEGDGWTCTIEPGAVRCTRPSLAAGESSTITIVVQADESIAGTDVTNVADVTTESFDPDLSNNHDEITHPVAAVIPDEDDQPPPPPPTPPVPSPPGGTQDELVRTGAALGGLAITGLLLTALGGALLALRRLRPRFRMRT